MNQDDPPTGFPSDMASLPSPPFLVWVIVLGVIVCAVYAGYYVIWGTIFGSSSSPGILRLIRQAISSPSSAGSLYNEISTVITPHPLSILVLATLVIGYHYYAPYVWATLQWAWMTITGQRIPDRITSEGFLVSLPGNPGVTEWVITRRELLDKLRQRLFAINPPHGIRCGTSPRRDVPHWEPSLKMIHLYLQRVANMHPVTTDASKATVTPASEKVAVREIRLLCEERSIIKEIIDKMEIDPTIQYSYRQAREHIQSAPRRLSLLEIEGDFIDTILRTHPIEKTHRITYPDGITQVGESLRRLQGLADNGPGREQAISEIRDALVATRETWSVLQDSRYKIDEIRRRNPRAYQMFFGEYADLSGFAIVTIDRILQHI